MRRESLSVSEHTKSGIGNPPNGSRFQALCQSQQTANLAARERPETLRVFGRLPVTGVMEGAEAGVRKASKEETAGDFAPAMVSVYGDLARVLGLISPLRIGTTTERAPRRRCWSP